MAFGATTFTRLKVGDRFTFRPSNDAAVYEYLGVTTVRVGANTAKVPVYRGEASGEIYNIDDAPPVYNVYRIVDTPAEPSTVGTDHDDSRAHFTLTSDGTGEWVAVMDPIAANYYDTPLVVSGYASKTALLDALKILGVPLD